MGREVKLQRADVSITSGTGRSGRSKARLSRSLGLSYSHFTFTHIPTGWKVSGRIIPGYYSRKELSGLEQKLCEELYKRLENEVATALKVAGRKAMTPSGNSCHNFLEIKVGEFSTAELLRRAKE